MDEIFNTESHEKELDMMFNETSALEEQNVDILPAKDFDSLYQIKANLRYTRKALFNFLKPFDVISSLNIAVITLPVDSISIASKILAKVDRLAIGEEIASWKL